MLELLKLYSAKQKLAMQVLRDYSPKIVGKNDIKIAFTTKELSLAGWVVYDKPNTININLNTPIQKIPHVVVHELAHCMQLQTGLLKFKLNKNGDLVRYYKNRLDKNEKSEIDANKIVSKYFKGGV